MAVYNIVGKLEVIGQPVPIQGRNGTFYKRDVVLDCSWYSRENGEKYDNHPIFEFVGDQVNIPAMYQVGMKVTISFVIQGNSSDKDGQRSYFNKLVGKNVVPYQPYQQGQGGPTNYPQQGGYGQGFNPGYPDVEDKWEEIAKAYIPDGIREFNDFPSASLGWMMYIGMAVAKFWDAEWEIYSKIEDLYAYMRDKRGYDAMDEYIREDVLLLQGVVMP